MSERALLRVRLHAVLVAEVGATAVLRLCPRCGSGEHGRPVARVGSGTAPSVSLSYAGGLAVVAWSYDGPVGVDVEAAGPPVEGVGDRLAWTRHEALAKATGLGLDAERLPDLPTEPLPLPSGWVGTVAGRQARWRAVGPQ